MTASHDASAVPRDSSGYLVVDSQWRIIAADDSGSLSPVVSPTTFMGHHVRDVIGAETCATLMSEQAARFTLEGNDYLLTATRIDLPGGPVTIIRAQEVETSLEHMVSSLVHEVRNPLSAMRALVQGLEEELDGLQDYRAYTSRLTGEIDRLNRLLLSMGHVSRLRSRPPELLMPLAVMERAAEVFRPELARLGVQVEVTVTPRVGPILGDPDQLQQVLLNLMRNSAEAMPQGGTIILRGRLDPHGRTTISVEDSGAGMNADALGRSPRPVQSLKPGGMGLGLMIVRDILRQHGARMRIASVAVHGTTVTLTFPVPGRENPDAR